MAPRDPNDDVADFPIHQPHDGLFRYVFSRTRHAASLLRTLVPAALAAAADWSSLELLSGKYVSPEFARSESDLLFSVRVNGQETLIHLLLEHQSTIEPLLALRMVGYVLAIWRQRLNELPLSEAPLPVIVPIVLHHGDRAWTAGVRLSDLFAIDDALRGTLGPHLLDVELIFDDLGGFDQADARRRPGLSDLAMLARFLLARARMSRDFLTELALFAAEFRAVFLADERTGSRDFVAILRYIGEVAEPETTAMEETVRALAGPQAEKVFKTLNDRLREEGLQKGRVEGRVEGEAIALKRLLERRFGPLSDDLRARIDAAPIDAIERWTDRIFDATSAEEVTRDADRDPS